MMMGFCLGKGLGCWESSTSLVRLCPTISSTSVGGKRQFVAQIPSMDAILMGYWVADQVSTMKSSVIYKSKFRIGDITLRRVLIIPCEIFLKSHLRSTRRIDWIDSGRGRADVCGEEYLQFWEYPCPCHNPTHPLSS